METRAKTHVTERERQVIELVCQGLTNAEIGGRLGLSAWTVKRHVARVLAKTGCRRRTDLAVRYGPTKADRSSAESQTTAPSETA